MGGYGVHRKGQQRPAVPPFGAWVGRGWVRGSQKRGCEGRNGQQRPAVAAFGARRRGPLSLAGIPLGLFFSFFLIARIPLALDCKGTGLRPPLAGIPLGLFSSFFLIARIPLALDCKGLTDTAFGCPLPLPLRRRRMALDWVSPAIVCPNLTRKGAGPAGTAFGAKGRGRPSLVSRWRNSLAPEGFLTVRR